MDDVEIEQLKNEFKSAEELHKFEVTIMLGQTTVYLLTTGALLGVTTKDNISVFHGSIISTFGIIISFVFLQIALRTGANLRGARCRAQELGKKLKYKLYDQDYRAKEATIFVGRNLTSSVCILGLIAWFLILY